MSEVILGMPGPWADDYKEVSDYYTTKVGGFPDWPIPFMRSDLDHLVDCSTCGSSLCLVAQIYAPVSSKTLTIEERVIYIFSCLTPKCGSTPVSWRALRVQRSVGSKALNIPLQKVVRLPAPSSSTSETDRPGLCTFNSKEEKDDGDDDIDLEELGRALSEAASLASHPKKQENHHHRKATVKPLPLSPTTRVIDCDAPVLPCFYVYILEEAVLKEVSSVQSKCILPSTKEYHSDLDDLAQEETWEEEGYEYDRALNADRTYLKFKKRMDAYPEQCFRYSYGGRPLVATGEAANPGKCRICGAPRHYEMQLMPPLLYFLHEATNDSQKQFLEKWTWMTVLVYTCSKSCHEKSNSDGWVVAEEAIVAQRE